MDRATTTDFGFVLMDKVYFSLRSKVEIHYESLVKSGLTHIIYLCEKPKTLRNISPTISQLQFNSKKSPIKKTAWISHFNTLNCIITEAAAQGSVWIIGLSRALVKLIITSYLITSRKYSIFQAINSIDPLSKVKNTALTQEYFTQLQLWYHMGGKIDSTFTPWTTYETEKLKGEVTTPFTARFRTRIIYECNERICEAQDAFKKGKLDLFSLRDLGDQNWGYCCGSCKTRLFTSGNILKHNMETNYQPILSEEYPCSALVVEPLRWMEGITGKKKGKILCYSCASEVGTWNWNKTNCKCCNTSLPCAFFLKVKAIKYYEPKKEIKVPTRTRSIKSTNIWKLLSNQTTKPKTKLLSPTASAHFKLDSTRIVAKNYSQMPKMYQKMLQKVKISPTIADKNWYIIKKAFLFVHNVKFFDSLSEEEFPTEQETEEIAPDPLAKLPLLKLGIKEFSKGCDSFVPEADDERKQRISRAHDDPVVMNYLRFVDSDWKASSLSFININVPNYIELAFVTFLNSQNPREVYKIASKATGKGGYGQVFTGKDGSGNKVNSKEQKVAIKTMEHLEPLQQAKNFKEVAVMASLSHPNIVKYYDCFQFADELWVAMELLSGGSLADMHDVGMFDESQIAYIATECLKALHYLHYLGLVHRDIKPGNIMLTASGQVKLIDFGLCDSVQTIADHPRMVGSPFWMPPEMIFCAPQTKKADVWSLGCTLLQLIDPVGFDIGCPLKTIITVATEGRVKFMQVKSYSAELVDFFSCMLHRQPEKRSSVAQLLEHRFLAKAGSSDCVADLIDKFAATKHF